MTVAAPWAQAEGKVRPWHRDRLAVIYIRRRLPPLTEEQIEQQVVARLERQR